MESSERDLSALNVNDTAVLVTAVEDIFRYDASVTALMIIAYAVIFIMGLIGNAFVLGVVFRTPRMKTTTNYLLVNLAVADILVLLICVPANLIGNILLPWILGRVLCKLVAYLQSVTVCASINTLVAISVDRYLAICYDPLRCPLSPHLMRHIVVIWSVALCVMSPTLIYQDIHFHSDHDVAMCIAVFPSDWAEQAFFVSVVLSCYVIPLLLIVLSYMCIFNTVWRRSAIGEPVKRHNAAGRRVDNQRALIQKSKIKVVRMICFVVVVFFVSWAPLYLLHGYITLVGFPHKDTALGGLVFMLYPVAQWLGLANSAVNPMVYAYFNKKFRHGFVAILKSRKCCGRLRDDIVIASRSRSSSYPLSTYLTRRCTVDLNGCTPKANTAAESLQKSERTQL